MIKSLPCIAMAAAVLAAAGCNQADEAAATKERSKVRTERAQSVIRAGAVTTVVSTEKGDLVTIATPSHGLSPGMVNVKTCRVWRDRELGSSSLECDEADDMLISPDQIEEFAKLQVR